MPNHGLTFTPRGRGGWALHGTGAHDHGTLRSPNTPSPTFKPSKDSSIYPLFFHILAHSFAHFCTHAKLNPFVFKQFRTLCAVHEGASWYQALPIHQMVWSCLQPRMLRSLVIKGRPSDRAVAPMRRSQGSP